MLGLAVFNCDVATAGTKGLPRLGLHDISLEVETESSAKRFIPVCWSSSTRSQRFRPQTRPQSEFSAISDAAAIEGLMMVFAKKGLLFDIELPAEVMDAICRYARIDCQFLKVDEASGRNKMKRQMEWHLQYFHLIVTGLGSKRRDRVAPTPAQIRHELDNFQSSAKRLIAELRRMSPQARRTIMMQLNVTSAGEDELVVLDRFQLFDDLDSSRR